MASKIYNEIKNEIEKLYLSEENKKIFNNINQMLYRYKNKQNLKLPVMILIKDIDNIDLQNIENLISKMLKEYKLFGGELKDTFRSYGLTPCKIVTSVSSGEAYKFTLDKMALETSSVDKYLQAIEKIIDMEYAFILLECKIDIEDILYIHPLYKKIDFIFSNSNTAESISNMLLNRYEYNKISTDIDKKELEFIVKNNLESNVYEKEETCLQYMFTQSIKSFMTSNRRKLKIEDIPVIEKIDDVIENLDKQSSIENVLSDLIGIDYIKLEIDKIIKFAIFNKNARKENSKLPKENLNMCFLGNPGTGKTTIAKAICNEFYKNGIIEKNELIEILPNDLMGEYVGHTKKATRNILNKAKGGILFIDEAYQILSQGYKNGNPFMNEALTELLKYMENTENIVIFAGYKSEIENMLNMNPGIKSRIAIKIEFKDYSTEQLKIMLDNELKLYNLELSDKANELAVRNIEQAKKNFDFGNCRYIKNFAIEIIKNHSYQNGQSKIILFDAIPKYVEKQKNKIGFNMEVVNG